MKTGPERFPPARANDIPDSTDKHVLKSYKDAPLRLRVAAPVLTRRNFLMASGVSLSAGLLVGGKANDGLAPSVDPGSSEYVALQVIVVATRQEASEILDLLNSGEPFDDLARRRSVDASAVRGGYVGKVSLRGLRPEIAAALETLHPGQITGVIETRSGFMIVKLLSEAASLDIESAEVQRRMVGAVMAKVQINAQVGGGSLAEHFFVLEHKPPNWNQNLQTICQLRKLSLEHGFQASRAALVEARSGRANQPDLRGLITAHEALAQLESYEGDLKSAIRDFEAEYQAAVSAGEIDAQHKLDEMLGIAYLAQGDIENEAKTVRIESSLFPMTSAGKFKLPSSGEESVKRFLQYLQRDPSDVEVKWLLNIACMKLGKYPDAVPPGQLIPPGAFKSKEDVGRFVDVAPALGLNTVQIAGGLIVDDFDNDGFLDVVTSSMGACAPMHYFHNNGDGTFTDRTDEAGLSGQLGGLNIIQCDYNNDGWLDILVLRGAWESPMRKSLLRNNGDGTFTDVTSECGLAVPATSTQTGAWADFDNDGHLDLFVGNENSPNQLFRNKGDGTFVDVAESAGVTASRFTKGVVAGDYDNDGYPDYYVSNLNGENFLYHNNHDGTFTDVARKLHVELPLVSFPVWFFDYNNDGWLDILVHSNYSSVVEFAAPYVNLPLRGEGSKLYRNMGNGTFQDVSRETGIDRSCMPMGCNFGDFDSDGFLDFYLGTGNPSYAAQVPNLLFKNHEGEYFVDVTTSSGTGSLQKGHGVAFADINNDGEEEILIQMGGMTQGDRAAMLVFRNPGYGNNWITVRCIGVKTNRAAIGARIKVTVEMPDHRQRSIHRVVGSGGSFGASPLQQHIGLGKAKRIVSLEVWWPTSNSRQTFHNVGMNQFIEVKEFAKQLTVRPRRSFPLKVG